MIDEPSMSLTMNFRAKLPKTTSGYTAIRVNVDK